MANNFTTYMRNAIGDHMLRNQSFTPPTQLYLGLYTTATDAAGGGTEVTGGSYARQTFDFAAFSSGLSSNDDDITFPVATGTWGTIGYAAVHDDISAGNMLIQGPLASPRTIATDDQFIVDLGDLDFQVDG